MNRRLFGSALLLWGDGLFDPGIHPGPTLDMALSNAENSPCGRSRTTSAAR